MVAAIAVVPVVAFAASQVFLSMMVRGVVVVVAAASAHTTVMREVLDSDLASCFVFRAVCHR